jgi:hypothetical protein
MGWRYAPPPHPPCDCWGPNLRATSALQSQFDRYALYPCGPASQGGASAPGIVESNAAPSAAYMRYIAASTTTSTRPPLQTPAWAVEHLLRYGLLPHDGAHGGAYLLQHIAE